MSHDTPVIDFGGHMDASNKFYNMGPERAELGERIGEKHTDPDTYVEWLKEGGIDGAALSQPVFLGHDDAEEAAESNDDLLDVVEARDELYGLAAIPTAAGGEVAAEEFERCLDAGFHGGALETMSGGVELVDEEVEPIFEVADRTGAPIQVHITPDDSFGTGAFDDRWRLNAIFGREAAQCVSIFKMIHEGVFDRYPNLTLVYHHLGGNIAAMLGRVCLQLDDRWPGRPDQRDLKSYPEFKAQLEERVYVDTCGFYGFHAPLRTALEEFPSTQVLFGTDAPYEANTSEELAEFIETVEDVASDTDSRRILGGNALDLMVNV